LINLNSFTHKYSISVQIAQSLEEILNVSATVNSTFVRMKDGTLQLFGRGFVSLLSAIFLSIRLMRLK